MHFTTYYITFSGYRIMNDVFSKEDMILSKRLSTWSCKGSYYDAHLSPGSIIEHNARFYVLKSVKYEQI